MEFYDTVKNRRTVREWSDKKVSEQSIRRIIESGLAAPSNNHLREWDFIVLHSDAEKNVALKFVEEWSLKQAESRFKIQCLRYYLVHFSPTIKETHHN